MKGKRINIIITALIAVCLFFAMPVSAYGAEAAVGDNIVRVYLNSYGDPASVSMNAAGSYTIRNNNKAISGAFTVSASGTAGIKITSGSTVYNLDGDVYIKAGSLSINNLIQINGSYRYAGDMRILNKAGKLKLINFVDIETYIMGVLPYEVSNTWPAETLKAHAIASRTYAYYTIHSKIRTSVEHDMVNSISHQVYNGYNSSNANCISAVNATKNTIMKTSGGQVVYACFSASNGGMTETGPASGAAAQDFDYLPLKEDPYDLAYALGSGTYSGKLWIPKAIAAQTLQTAPAQPYKMLREKLTASGVDVSALTGNVTIKSITLRDPKATKPDRQYTGAGVVVVFENNTEITLSFAPVTFPGSVTKYPFLNEVLGLGTKFSMLTVRDDGADWLLASVRYGHGAGLSQVGAYQMAQSGKTYKDILSFYYNVGSAASLVTMPWDGSGGTDVNAPGYTVTDVKKTGTVNTPGTVLNVRSGPGTGHSILTSLTHGTKVTITGQVAEWWRIDLSGGKTGFVSSAFITITSETVTTPQTPDPPKPETTPPPAVQTKTGKVNTPGTVLNVRSGAGTTYAILGTLKNGEKVTVTTENSSWYKLTFGGRTGYISAAYIILDGSSAGTATQPPAAAKTRTVYVNTPGTVLNVRSGPGTTYTVLGSLKHNEKISVTDENSSWYKLKDGYNGKAAYVSKTYTKDDASQGSTAQPAKTGTVNTSIGLNVRSGPSTGTPIIGGLGNGTKVTIIDQSGAWYKINYGSGTGWISASYVKL